ncbi:MAG: beta-N-acetylhexosaminidase [Gammaproteobacteria bacterium]|nr:beta-N-acetylhexosaminidase [Gammaproteobacteria bacterium]MDH5728020.1 beta-N-acetylhexosaminidase [Gammaproteobacteria bacterium]
MELGPVIIDIEGTELSAEDKELLQHPLVGGLIYFTRNFESVAQIQALDASIKALRQSSLLTCIDHEGGRVQRFRQGFTQIPAMRALGNIYDQDQSLALSYAKEMGWLMATEARVVGIDFSFAPVLDMDYGVSGVIGNRAFHSHAEIIIQLAREFIDGMSDAGMASVGKHFPGHGGVLEDSHLDLPHDRRDPETIVEQDMSVFKHLIHAGKLDGIMPAHVIYEQFDKDPAGFSKYWIPQVLRRDLGFDGVVFSDDLNMAAAGVAGSFIDRAYAALEADCDMILVCNNRAGAIEVLDNLKWLHDPSMAQRFARMRGQPMLHSMVDLQKDSRWQHAQTIVSALVN